MATTPSVDVPAQPEVTVVSMADLATQLLGRRRRRRAMKSTGIRHTLLGNMASSETSCESCQIVYHDSLWVDENTPIRRNSAEVGGSQTVVARSVGFRHIWEEFCGGYDGGLY